MLDRLKSLFSNLKELPESGAGAAFAPDDARVAVAALLVHMIRIDGDVSEAETTAIRLALDEQFGLSGATLEAVVEEATRRDNEAVDLYGFTSVLKAKLSEEERVDVIEMLWRAVFADGVVNEFEDNMVWRTAELLGVSARDRMVLRRRVAGSADDA